jgi:hypothetical protein
MSFKQLRLIARAEHPLQHLGRIRDGLLVIGALLYGFGYASWAAYAWLNNLGPMPGLDAQYFVAGIPILLFIILGLVISKILGFLYFSVWFTLYSEGSVTFKIISNVVFLGSFILCWVLFFISFDPAGRMANDKIAMFVLSIILILLIIPVLVYSMIDLLQAVEKELRKRPEGFSGNLFIMGYLVNKLAINTFNSELREYVSLNRVIIIMIALLFSGLYIRNIYPKIPQTLGGAKPRTAILNIYADKISGNTCLRLVEKPDTSRSGAVIRSKPLPVFYESKDNLIVVPVSKNASTDTLFDLKKETISSIEWINR